MSHEKNNLPSVPIVSIGPSGIGGYCQLELHEQDRQVREMMNEQHYIEWQLGCSVREMQDFAGADATRQFIDSLPGVRR
jgi:hypothetical protein